VTTKPRRPPNLPATDSAPKPGDFPLGSPKSRAASHVLLEQMGQSTEKIRVVVEYIGAPEKNLEFEVPYLNAGKVRE
jgi:hypothetical protein